MSEYMIRTGFDRAFQISFNIIRMLKGCRDVVDTMRGCGGHGEWQVGSGLSQNQVALQGLGFRVQGLGFRRRDERDHPNEFEDGTLGIVRQGLREEGTEGLVSLVDVVVA